MDIINAEGFIPETLDWCKRNYVPKVDRFINCNDFGNMDGMDGSCHWCLHMTPYQWEMCNDEKHIRGLLRENSCGKCQTREEAIEFIQKYKQKY